jgi:hypothetical protein
MVLGWDSGTVSRKVARGQPYGVCPAYTRRRSRKLLDPWLWRYVRTHLARGFVSETSDEWRRQRDRNPLFR